MISEKMLNMVQNSSAIRAMFEEGKKWRLNMVQKMSMISALEIQA